MKTLPLIERLTWAIVEISNPAGKPDLGQIAVVLNDALQLAILTQEAQTRITAALIRNAQVMGDK